MDFNDLFEEVIFIEEEIEGCYISMAQAEQTSDKEAYFAYFENLKESLNKEKKLISDLIIQGYYKKLVKIIKENTKNNPKINIILGKNTNAFYYRLKYIVETLSGDDILDYINTLRYDRNKIMIRIIDNLLDNPDYEIIREDLILYKHDLNFLNMYNEDDFIKGSTTDLALGSRNFRTSALPCSTYIDQAILLSPSKTAINHLESLEKDNIREDSNAFFLIVLRILNIIGSITLCEEEYANEIYENLKDMITDEDYNEEVKDVIKDMIKILESIREDISWGRK